MQARWSAEPLINGLGAARYVQGFRWALKKDDLTSYPCDGRGIMCCRSPDGRAFALAQEDLWYS